jgi:uncharacterized protein (DUF58 family)
MVVPRNRLLFWFGAIVLPFALLAVVEPAAALISTVIVGSFLAVAIADALLAPRRLCRLSVELPGIARMSKDRAAGLELRLRNTRQTPKTLRLALALPRQIQSLQEDARVQLPAGSEWSRLTWPCIPRQRGRYHANAARLETRSPLGLWDARKTVPAHCELRVYPNLLAGRRDLAALFLHRGSFGLHAQRQLGKGREFEKLREYVAGDGYDEIHWKATAKRGHPITKVFQIERTQEVYVILDASRLSARVCSTRSVPRGGNPPLSHPHPLPPLPPNSRSLEEEEEKETEEDVGPPSTLERFITAALLLGLAAEQQGDFFGLLAFSDKVERFVRAKTGKAHYSACRDALYHLEPRLVSPDFDEVCSFIRLRLRRRALLIFLTALDDPVLAESFVRNLDLIRRQHLVVVDMLRPAGVEPLFSNPEVADVDDLYQHLGGHLRWQKLRELEKVLQRRGVRFSLVANENLAPDLVSQYLGVKRRQAL